MQKKNIPGVFKQLTIQSSRLMSNLIQIDANKYAGAGHGFRPVVYPRRDIN